MVYESPSGDMICFDYTHMQQGAANIIAPGDDEILDVTVNGIQGQFFLPHDPADAKTITWIELTAIFNSWSRHSVVKLTSCT